MLLHAVWAGYPALHLAVVHNRVHVALAILNGLQGADKDALDSDGLTALFHAAAKGLVDMANLLLDRGADINAGSVTPLVVAIMESQVAVVQLLLARSAAVDPVCQLGDDGPLVTALAAACANGRTQLALSLIFNHDADPLWRCPLAGMAVDIARSAGHTECADSIEVGRWQGDTAAHAAPDSFSAA